MSAYSTLGQKFCMIQFWVVVLETLHSTNGKKKRLNFETEKYYLLRFSVSVLRFLHPMCHKALQRSQQKLDHAELLSLSVYTYSFNNIVPGLFVTHTHLYGVIVKLFLENLLCKYWRVYCHVLSLLVYVMLLYSRAVGIFMVLIY